MRKYILGLIVILAIVSCENTNKQSTTTTGFTINGFVGNLNSKIVYLYNSNNELTDSTLISNSKFKFSGTSNTTEFATILFKKDSLSVDALLENTDFQLYVSKNQQLFFGGKAQQQYNNYLEGLHKLEKSKLSIVSLNFKNERISTQLDSLNSVIIAYNLAHLKEMTFTPIKSKIVNNLLSNSDLNLNNLIEIKSITDTFNDSIISDKVNSALESLKAIELEKEKLIIKNAKLKTIKRQLAPMFSGESLNGSDLDLSTILSGKKAVLIDFWASWCGPCRQITPEIRDLYNKYKNKGFDIITISEDRNRNAWKSGLSEDQILIWNHIYDDNMRIAYMFNVTSIPHMVLLDGKGGIINRKISVSNLKSELASICD